MTTFDEVVQLRNPTELLPVRAGDVASTAYFCSVVREGRKVAVVVKTTTDTGSFQHGTVAHVVGTARSLNDTLCVYSRSISAVDNVRVPRAEPITPGATTFPGLPVIIGPRSTTMKEKRDAFHAGSPHAVLLHISASRGKQGSPSVVVRTRVANEREVAEKGLLHSLDFWGVVAEVTDACVVLEISDVTCVGGRGGNSRLQSALQTVSATFQSLCRMLRGCPMARAGSGVRGRMEIYSAGIFFSQCE